MLLEATIFNYFRHLEATKEYHSPSWTNVFERLGGTLPQYELQNLVKSDFLLCFHVYVIHKLRVIKPTDEKITFLQNVYTILEDYKTK